MISYYKMGTPRTEPPNPLTTLTEAHTLDDRKQRSYIQCDLPVIIVAVGKADHENL